jgi:hypothetical protein
MIVRMIFLLRPYLVTLLVLLQLIAPLVHAHTGEQVVSQGIHLPGLERYVRFQSQATSSNDALCQAIVFYNDSDGLVVGIHTGLQRETALPVQRLAKKIIVDLDHGHAVPFQLTLFNAFSLAFFSIPLTTAPRLVTQLTRVAHTPRAPPQTF